MNLYNKICFKRIILAASVYVAASFLLIFPVKAQQTQKENDWRQWHFLLGEWTGEGNSSMGKGSGGFSFDFDLQKRIIARKNHSFFPATKDKPAYSHDDLMIIYKDDENKTRAIYFDNEGHVINYKVGFSDDQNSVTFISDIIPNSPRYKLTYTKTGENTLNLKFEIAPANQPGGFTTYINANAFKK